jgi:hypothetical protein
MMMMMMGSDAHVLHITSFIFISRHTAVDNHIIVEPSTFLEGVVVIIIFGLCFLIDCASCSRFQLEYHC